MKAVAIALIIAGFVLGALFAVLQVETVAWTMYAAALAAGLLGIFLLRRTRHAGARDEHHVAGNLGTLEVALEQITQRLEDLVARREEIPPHEFRFEIDRLFRDDLERFAEARESMQHAFGLQVYADIMSAFAAGERYINRVWTASADGYIDEVITYLDKAHRQFAEAREAFRTHRG